MKSKLKQSKWITWCALSLLATSAVISTARADQQTWGTILGGVVGGIAGSAIGGGNGKTIATIIGAAGGAVAGNSIGASLDEKDQAEAENAYLRSMNSAPNQPVEWAGDRDHGNHGRFQTESEFRNDDGLNCRTYVSESWINGQYSRREGTSCLFADGSWREWDRTTTSAPAPRPVEVRRFRCIVRDDFGATYMGYGPSRGEAEDAAVNQCSQYRNPRFCQSDLHCDAAEEIRYEDRGYDHRYPEPRYNDRDYRYRR
jgi:surface antigen